MDITYGNFQGAMASDAGPGVSIHLDGNEVASAIYLWLQMQGIDVQGPRTVKINNIICREVGAHVFVDPSGYVVDENGKCFNGSGVEKNIEENKVTLKLVKSEN
jgi:hypothetical protein